MEIDLLKNYPKTKRNTSERNLEKDDSVRAIARQFGKEFFDGERKYGYGGFQYAPRFWRPVVPDFVSFYKLSSGHSVLDVGCAKGFFLFDLVDMVPGIKVAGIDISEYAVKNAKSEVASFIKRACATSIPFASKSFDLVVSINTIHNLEIEQCATALEEIQRVSRGNAFITVDAYRNDEERKRMFEWNLTARTIMHVDEWIQFFKKVGYSGDYYWFIP